MHVFVAGEPHAYGLRDCRGADGNHWSGQNLMPGSQSSVTNNIGGGTMKFASD
jgi:hypothetical protein